MVEKKAWAKCDCGQEMAPGSGCTANAIHLGGRPEDDDASYAARIPYDGSWSREGTTHCPDCNAGTGEFHHMGCDVERCPICGSQLIGCECWDGYVTETVAVEGG